MLVFPSYKKGRIQYFEIHELRPHTGIPEPYILSVPFVNAHSHLEYFGIDLHLSGLNYFDWIVRLTELKAQQSSDEVRDHCRKAAEQNYRTGVGWIGEHSDRFGSAEALEEIGIGGWIFQEVLDFFASEGDLLPEIKSKLAENRKYFPSASLTSHALHTVHESTLLAILEDAAPVSIHTNETALENEFFVSDTGRIAESRRSRGFSPRQNGLRVVESLDRLGVLKPTTQLVHGCDFGPEDIEMVALLGATVAHCPRSNQHLGCPKAPIREMLDAGVSVGIGIDSAASSGPIDFFAEMRAAFEIAGSRGKPLSADEVLRMATSMGHRSFGQPGGVWDVREGATVPLIELHLPRVRTGDELIHEGDPECIRWLG